MSHVLTEEISNASNALWDVPGQQFCDLNFDNYVHGDVQFIGQPK